jgi:tetratricopeptide (TPR) repeat protein
MTMVEKTCFVVMGYGEKTDFATGRKLDLNKTYEYLIKPVVEGLGIKCIRSDEIIHSGVIDVVMYKWLLDADLVIADISTSNVNAVYELGVRHVLKPNSTIIMAESQLKFPFDLNHITLMHYEHLGTDIGMSTVVKFTKQLKEKIEAVMQTGDVDSPVYTYLNGLNPPSINANAQSISSAVRAESSSDPVAKVTLSALMNAAEDAMDSGNYLTAIALFNSAKALDPNSDLIAQRLALCTYKSKSPDPMAALLEAEKILIPLNPEITTDVETLGLCGAINKRLYELTMDNKYLVKALDFYGRGYTLKQDYYNGINVAYLYNVAAGIANEEEERIAYRFFAKKIRLEVIDLCNMLINDPNFADRSDREWIVLTLAEGYFGTGNMERYNKTITDIEVKAAAGTAFKGSFNRSSFEEQMAKLKLIL